MDIGVSSGGTESADVYTDVYTSKNYLTVHLRFGRVLRVQDTAIKNALHEERNSMLFSTLLLM